ncbi:MAG: FtsX-like permease family protein [Acidobacteria bacterium]|nr:FtsX-like permease family protein [Acidobacteriota bacterium]
MDPRLPPAAPQTLESQLVNGPVETQLRVATAVAGSVGLVGLLLAAIGLYGVTAHAVTRRTREIGIRLSLGAARADVVGLILRQGMTLVTIGAAIGSVLSLGAGRILAARFGDPTGSLPVFLTAALLFLLVGLIACYMPVRRATRISAVEALRYE